MKIIKLLSLLLAAAMIFAGCSKKEENGGESGSSGGGTPSQVTDTAAYNNFKAIFPDSEFVNAYGNEKDSKYHILMFKDSGVRARYLTVKSQKKGEKVNIMFITDTHLNRISQADLSEANPAVMASIESRKWCKNEASLPMLKNVMQYADRFDALALGGDNIDYVTLGSLDCLKETVFDVYKKPLVAVLGGHDLTRTMENSTKDPDSANIKTLLGRYWPHDVNYYSTVVKDRVMLIGLEANGRYLAEQKDKLAADIEKARKENLVIFIFEHEPIATNNEAQREVKAFGTTETASIGYRYGIGGKADKGKVDSNAVYELVTSSADVIKGIFCGHEHYDFYSEIKASYNDGDKKVETFIPQYTLRSNAYGDGAIFAITVE